MLSNTISMDTPKYNDTGGSWWGHNQQKLANIEDVVFYVDYDNSNLDFGNSSVDNPFVCNFMYLVENVKTEFDEQPCNSPGNILADAIHNKVYYIIVEPTGPAATGGFGWTGESTTVMYEYDFSPSNNNLDFVEKHIVTPSISDGKIRQGTTIDDFGNIAIAYGSYSYNIELYLYNFETQIWSHEQVLSNNDNDTLMYCHVVMKDLDHVYILAHQDTAREGDVYYQYVKFFAFEDDAWTSKMIVDYRTHELAEESSTLVLNSDLYLDGDNIHILANATEFMEVTYYVYDGENYSLIEAKGLPKSVDNIKLESFDSVLYFITYSDDFQPTMKMINVETGETVYSVTGVSRNRYIYPLKITEEQFLLLIYPDQNELGNLYTIDKK